MSSQAYDVLMDHLAELMVTAVQHPTTAVHAYGLLLTETAQHGHPLTPFTLGDLLRHGRAGATLPAWAQPLAPAALGGLLQHGRWFDTSFPPWPLRHPPLHWDDLLPYCYVPLQWVGAYTSYVDELWEQVRRLWHAVCMLYGPGSAASIALPEEVWRGVVLFDAGLYFACHEYFETLWGRTDDVASDFYQGLIQVAVAMRHLESHNVRGALILLRYGLGRLQRYPAIYKGVAVARLQAQLESLLATLDALPNPATYQFDPSHVPRLVETIM
jgi:hypothetical protein